MSNASLPGIGHNQGPSMDPGLRWRIHSWTRAKAQHPEARLPVAVVRMRIARAKELGLSYADYAALRRSAGRDVAGYLLSSNALGVLKPGQAASNAVRERLEGLRHVRRIGLAHAPLSPEALLEQVGALDEVWPAPPLLATFARQRAVLARAQGRLPAAGLIAVTALALESDWLAAGRLGGILPAAALFG
ncbi:hypothetical protein KM176_06280 [Pseudooceanicola sp. CBS1P-1]|uniref:Uncharacterized protein n=1 Tax=Pseudooceanicola albus TaxID=2692189 RepID=A0A6L7FX05_9RHOB|nr:MULTISPECIES: hypothetical protein [Pseudooceanicola]MBT9383459.1 hypothetical protein [Pseudooceanicola endophyticus]MXN16219.1 hypothetical protein [Pseudooceanicola albus]